MNNLELQLAAFLARYAWVACSIGCGYLIGTWRAYRTRRYAREFLARSEQRNIERLNAQQKLLLQTFFAAGQSTLTTLADDTESEFTLKR